MLLLYGGNMKLFETIDSQLKSVGWIARDSMCWYPTQSMPKRYHLWYDRSKDGTTEWLIVSWGSGKSYDINYQEWASESFGRNRKFSFTKQSDALETLANLGVFK
jgi:hypothetical protein